MLRACRTSPSVAVRTQRCVTLGTPYLPRQPGLLLVTDDAQYKTPYCNKKKNKKGRLRFGENVQFGIHFAEGSLERIILK